MSSLDYTYKHLDDHIDRQCWVAPEIDPKKTALLVLDLQKLICDPKGAAYVQSVAGAPEGKDVIEPCRVVVEACREAGIPVFWSLWGLRGDHSDAGIAALKWPGLDPGAPGSPASWGNRDAELVDELQPRDDEIQIHKHRFGTFYNTPFDEYLRERGVDTLVIVGVTSANCMHATAVEGWNRNYKVVCIADATTCIPHSGADQPVGTGQHWEALRQIQMNYGDVLLSTEFLEKLERALQG